MLEPNLANPNIIFQKCLSCSTPHHKANNLIHRLPNTQNASRSSVNIFLNTILYWITNKFCYLLAFWIQEKTVQMNPAQSFFKWTKSLSKDFFYQLPFPEEWKKNLEANPIIISTSINHCYNARESSKSHWRCCERWEVALGNIYKDHIMASSTSQLITQYR